MGHRPMLTVKNNKNLIKKRKSIFEIFPMEIGKPRKDIFENDISLYEKDQIIKRRQKIINSYRKNIWLKNLITLVLLLFVITLILLVKP